MADYRKRPDDLPLKTDREREILADALEKYRAVRAQIEDLPLALIRSYIDTLAETIHAAEAIHALDLAAEFKDELKFLVNRERYLKRIANR